MVDGHSLTFATSEDEVLIRRRTVRLVHEAHGSSIFDCSGVIVDESTVITAAHCRDPSVEKFWQRGEVFVEVLGERDEILRFQVTRAKSEDSERMDLMILTVSGRMPFPVSLPLTFIECDNADDYLVAGYGMNTSGEYGHELYLGTYHHIVVSGLWEFELASGQGKICGGDSGAGVFCRRDGHLGLVGVVNSFYRNESISPLPYKPQLCRDGVNLVGTSVRAIDDLRAEKP